MPFAVKAKRLKVPRLGFLGAASASGYQVDALRTGLRDFGYIEDKNIAVDYRFAEGQYDRLPKLAAELVNLDVDIIVTHAAGVGACKAATATIPIVMAISADATALGLVANLARPGGNITGSTFFNPEMMAKRLELLKELPGAMSRIAVLLKPEGGAVDVIVETMQATAKPLGIELRVYYARGRDEFAGAFADMSGQGCNGAVIRDDPAFVTAADGMALEAAKYGIPSISNREFGSAGGLMGYGPNLYTLFRRSGYFVDRILKGANPRDLPIEQPTKFDLVLNLKTAHALKFEFPVGLLARADEVIE